MTLLACPDRRCAVLNEPGATVCIECGRRLALRPETPRRRRSRGLGPGERLVDGEVMYSADWLNDERRRLKSV
jgi:hypothetical protein